MSKAQAFEVLIKSDAGDVAQANVVGAKKREKKRMVLEQIVSFEFSGQMGFALRGHRDSGILLMPQSKSSEIDYMLGKFRATLRFMAACNDKVI